MIRSLLVVTILLASAAGHPAPLSAQGTAPARILVMPFDNVKREPSIFWLGEASAVLLADDLNAAGASAITRDERREAFERLQVPPTASLTDATVIRIGQLVGASEVITGSLQLEGATLVVHARGLALESGRISHDVIERGPIADMFATFERVARRFAPSTAASARAGPPHPPLAVFENYIKGLLTETPATAIAYMNAALKALPQFDRARLGLWEIFADQSDHALALAAVLPVAEDSPWSRRATFLAGLSYLSLHRNDEAFAAFKSLADAQPLGPGDRAGSQGPGSQAGSLGPVDHAGSTAAAFSNIGVVQLRRGSTPQTGQATYYFNKAAELDPNDVDYFFNLGYAYWQMRDTSAAAYWLREAVRRNPADGDAHFILGAALAASGSMVEASRERELARRLSSTYEQWEKRPAAEAVPKGLERVKGGVELPHAQQIEATLAAGGQRDQRELARFYFDRGQRLFRQENDRDAIVELNRAIFLSPYDADAHLLVGRIHLRNNRGREAIDAFKISLWSSETAPAHIALGEAYLRMKDTAAAKLEAERALTLDSASSDGKALLDRISAQ